MTLQEAYQGWQQLQQNRALFAKTREAFRKSWLQLPTNKPCEFYTKDILGELLAATDQAEENKAKAASVMIHVLTYAHQQEPGDNPMPRFTYDDLMKYTKVAPEKKRTIRKVDDEICQLDPKTLKVIKRWPHAHRIHQELGIGNVRRAIERCGVAGGFYWTYSADLDTFAKRLAAHKDHNAQAHADHCAKMREAKKPQITQIDTEEKIHTEEKPKRRKKPGDTVGTVPAVGSDAKERTTEELPPSVVTPTDEGGKKTKPKSGDNSKTAKVGTKVSVSTTEGQQMGTVPAVTPESSHQGQSPLCPDAAAPGDNRFRASKALEVFTDEELFAELDRRGWHGCFSRTEIVTIGKPHP